MKLTLKNSILLGCALLALPSAAQTTETGYFNDEYTFRYEMNPAMGNRRNFVSIPALGNINVDFAGTLHTNAVLYNVDGKTTTFLNPQLSAAEVMKKFKDTNRLDIGTKIDVISFGFKGIGGYNTVTIGARADVGLRIPKTFFQLAKEGISNQNYDITNLGAQAQAYAEVALNHSRNITSEWRVGATVKFLVGLGNVDIRMNKAQLDLGYDSWNVLSNAEINTSIANFRYKTKMNDNTHHEYVSGMDVDGVKPNGFGLGFDLGAVYSPEALPDWRFSAALLDLGFISWGENYVASTNGDRTFRTDKYTFNVDDDATNSFKNEWEILKDDLSGLYELEDMGNQGGRTTALHTSFNIGAEYSLPVYKPLSFGLLNTTRLAGKYTWTDFRLSANIAPCKVFSASASVSAGTFGCGFGWLMNVHSPGFNFFLGMDHTLGKLAKQGVPLNSNGSVNLGLSVLF